MPDWLPWLAKELITGAIGGFVGGFIGSRIQRRIDNKRRIKDFFEPYYADLWEVVQNVNSVIARGRLINAETVLTRFQDKYSTEDINSYLTNCVQTDDPELQRLLHQFSEAISCYMAEKTDSHGRRRLQFPSLGDGQTDFKHISGELTEAIRERIQKHLTV
jgi:hypothetical protein